MYTFKGSIKSKLPRAGTTIFSIMTALANETGAINLSQGFPNFSVSAELVELIYKAMKDGHNQYAPMPGLMSLRERLSKKIAKLYSANYDPVDEITITAGGTQAIYTAIASVVNEGEEVIFFEPAYDCYAPAIELAGGIPIPVKLNPPDYKISWKEVKKLVNQKTRMIIINTPHNPTGTILSASDLTELEKLTASTDIVVLSDEVYEHIIFDKYEHQSVARFPGLIHRSFIVYSFGKTFHATGWKIGYCVGPANLMKEFRKVHQFQIFSVNTPIQYALAAYLENPANYSGLETLYQNKRDYFKSLLSASKFKILPCYGTYFQVLNYSNISKEKDTEFAKLLTIEFGVASIPVSVFYSHQSDHQLLRFCFAKDDETLARAAEKLNTV
jgi:methionine aminotransferase